MKHDVTDQKLLDTFQALFDFTFKGTYTRDRQGGRVPKKLVLQKAIKVHNDQNWHEFQEARGQVGPKVRQYQNNLKNAGHDTNLWTFPESNVGPPLTKQCEDNLRKQGKWALDDDLKEDECGEFWFWHGTSLAGANGITSGDFRVDLAGSNAGTLYGNGVYLAENCSKSDEYTTPVPNSGAEPDRILLLCRGLVGTIFKKN